jgi:hypothetical protein
VPWEHKERIEEFAAFLEREAPGECIAVASLILLLSGLYARNRAIRLRRREALSKRLAEVCR